MNVAVLGSGGREHAIAWKLKQSEIADKIFVIPGNGGTENNVNIPINDFSKIRDFSYQNNVKLIFVGPEQPLAEGIVDFFKDSDILVFGPDKRAAQLESSKIFAKQFMKKYHVATADFELSEKGIDNLIEKTAGKCVIKYSGLAGGKGVFVCSNKSEANSAIAKIKEKYGKDARLYAEELLEGEELSILGITDGNSIKLFMPSQDHKQLYNGDKGPNTGGMGAYTPVDFCDINLLKEITKKVIMPTMKGIKSEQFNYKGVIYFGLMITKEGPKVLEYNVRFGDPETQVILPSFKGDLLKLVLSSFNGSLPDFKMDFTTEYFVNVVAVSGGYPDSYQKGYEITGLDKLNTLIFHAGTKKIGDKIVTNGGRVLSIVAKGKNLDGTIEKVYKEIKKIHFTNIYYRTDIGKRNG